MSFFSKFKSQKAVDRINEEKIYEAIVKELQQGIRREGLWAKALAKSEGNESKAKSLYIEFRAQSITDEIELAKQAAIADAEKARIKSEEIRARKASSPEEIERIKRLKKAAKNAGAKYIPD